MGVCFINESDGFALMPNGKKIVGRLLYVSETSTIFIKQILLDNDCDLTIEDSLYQHKLFLEV